MNITQRILETLRKDSGRVCPTCNDFLTAPGNERWENCEACRRVSHVNCLEWIDGSPYCSQCSAERRKEIALDAAMDALKAFTAAARPHLQVLSSLNAEGEIVSALFRLTREASETCDRWEFPQCPVCSAYAAPVRFTYRGEVFDGCVECRGRMEPEPVVGITAAENAAIEANVPF